MPSSSTYGKLFIMALLQLLCADRKRSIIDIGPGDGTFARLLKAQGIISDLVAVEVWGPYIRDYKLENLYNKVICGDARFVDYKAIGSVDIVIAGDVLEHMSFDDGKILLAKLLQAADVLICSIPTCHAEQGDEYGNPFERHIEEDYSEKMITELAPGFVFCHADGYIGVGVFTSRSLLTGYIHGLCVDAQNSCKSFSVRDFDYPALEEVIKSMIVK